MTSLSKVLNPFLSSNNSFNQFHAKKSRYIESTIERHYHRLIPEHRHILSTAYV
jgi:hypothetical protein